MSPKPERASPFTTRTIGWSALAAVLALTSFPAATFAQDRENRRGGGLQTQAQPSQNRGGSNNTGGGLRVRDSSQMREVRSPSARPENAPQRAQQTPSREASPNRGGGLQTQARQVQSRPSENRNVQRQETVRPSEPQRNTNWRNNDQRRDNTVRNNDNRNWSDRSTDQRRDNATRNTDQRRDGNWRSYDQRQLNNARNNDRRDNNWRNNDRRDNNWRNNDNRNWSDRNNQRWDRNWRNNNRYDWHSHRTSNRNTYRLGRYYAPYRNYNYRRVGIGLTLGSLFYTNRYWVSDPWQYRLPEVYGPYRWVRYYDDVLLVNTYTGEVVDVIYDFFW